MNYQLKGDSLATKGQTRKQIRAVAQVINLAGTTFLVLEDGRITDEDYNTIALGVLQALLIASEEQVIGALSKPKPASILKNIGRTLTGIYVIYLGGAAASYYLAGNEGVKDYHDFIRLFGNDPGRAAQKTVNLLPLLAQDVYLKGTDIVTNIEIPSFTIPNPIEIVQDLVLQLLNELPLLRT